MVGSVYTRQSMDRQPVPMVIIAIWIDSAHGDNAVKGDGLCVTLATLINQMKQKIM